MTSTAYSLSIGDVNAVLVGGTDSSGHIWPGLGRNDTLILPAGTGDWGNSGLAITKGITIKGNGLLGSIISCNYEAFNITPDATAIANEEIIRLDGFTLDGKNDPAMSQSP